MTLQVTYYEVKDPAQIRKEFQQTPIFIGTATEKVVVPMISGSFSLAIPKTQAGTKYRDDIFKSELKYWAISGKGHIGGVSPTGREIQLDSNDTTYALSRDQLKLSVLFIIHNDSVVFSTPMDSIEFVVTDKKFFIKDAHLTFKMPDSLPTYDCVFAIPQIQSNHTYTISNNTIVFDALPNQLVANNLNTIIEGACSFYYDITDFRWARIKYEDTLPTEFKYNKYSKLGMAAMLHRRVSTADMTLFSVPNESLFSLETVLSEIELNPYKYGYAIVPLWVDATVNNTIAAYVHALEQNRAGFQITYVSHNVQTMINIFPNLIATTQSETQFDYSYSFYYGQDYGKASD